MKTRTSYFVLILFLLLLAVASTQAQTTNADFQQAVSAYQQSPNDLNKAEKVIRMAAAMDQLPPIPEEARRHFVRGTALFKDAKSPEDYKQVIEEFSEAIKLAPWWPETRYNWALAFEAAGDYAKAIDSLQLYRLFKLPETEARAVQDKIYALEAKQEKAAQKAVEGRQAQQAAAEERKVREPEDFLRRINGAQYVHDFGNGFVVTLTVLGDTIRGNKDNSNTYKIAGHKLQGYLNGQLVPWMTGSISEDGNTIGLDSGNTNILYVRVR